MKYTLFVLSLAFAVLGLAGCGSGKPIVTGVVTLDGKPLENGTIQFFPVAGDGQTSAATLAADGSYRMEASPTKMKVVIHAVKIVGKRKMYEGQADSPTIDLTEELVPARYSDMNKTELTYTVTNGPNKADFALQSNPKK